MKRNHGAPGWAVAAWIVVGVVGVGYGRAPEPSASAGPPALLGRALRGALPGLPGSAGHVYRRLQSGGILIDAVGSRRSGAGAEWVFAPPSDGSADRYARLEYRADQWYGSAYWTGPDWTRVGKDWHHPGIGTASVRRYDVSRTGRAIVSGAVRKADLNGGDGIRARICLGSRTVWSTEVAFNDPVGVDPHLTLDLKRGDVLRFVVDNRGAIACDTTWWDPSVTYADGERHQASAAFASARQGEGGWSYELEKDPAPAASGPTLYGIARDTGPLLAACDAGRPVMLHGSGALPVAVLADAGDSNGVAVAVRTEGAWSLSVAAQPDGSLRLAVARAAPCARVLLAPYAGPAANGFRALDAALREAADAPGAAGVRRAAARAAGSEPVEFGLWWLVVADWFQADGLPTASAAATPPSACTAAARRHLDGAWRILQDLGRTRGMRMPAARARWRRLAVRAARPDLGPAESRALYLRVRWLKRGIALANPLVSRGPLLFCKRVPPSYSHLVMQYFGWRARPGGGLFVLARPGHSLACRSILGERLAGGSVLEPRLSFDARRVVFSWVPCSGAEPDPETLVPGGPDYRYYHVYEVGVDGSGLRQVTRGPYDDLMPTYLPDGGIAFCSTRRGGYARCFGPQFSRRTHVYTLQRVERDGTGLRTLSVHDTNEWFPAVGADGQIVYSRWDYIDRDAVTHQNLWTTRPDGTAPAALWGNATPAPDCAFQPQPIPGTRKIVFTASAHHSVTGGSIVVVDPAKGDNGPRPLTRITPEVPFPEAESMDMRSYYASPWPLSERYFLVSYSPYPLVWEPGANRADALGIYLLDAFGNRELLYRDPEIGSASPCPLKPRPAPPVLPSVLPRSAPDTGEVVLQDVYEGLPGLARGAVRELRVVQIFPKSTHVANAPPIGVAGEENGRAVLGTARVEQDGSARFLVPAGKPILFQALLADGTAYQTMRSLTYLQPGERVSCAGCHERRAATGRAEARRVLAMRRPPEPLRPGPGAGRPFSYMETVQPVLDRRCVSCHSASAAAGRPGAPLDLTRTPRGPYAASYLSLCGDRDFTGPGTNPRAAAEALVPRFGARNQVQVTPPGGAYGARGSRLLRLLREGHHGVALQPEEFRALALWIDLNAIFYGVNDPAEQARQFRGEPVAMPALQ